MGYIMTIKLQFGVSDTYSQYTDYWDVDLIINVSVYMPKDQGID